MCFSFHVVYTQPIERSNFFVTGSLGTTIPTQEDFIQYGISFSKSFSVAIVSLVDPLKISLKFTEFSANANPKNLTQYYTQTTCNAGIYFCDVAKFLDVSFNAGGGFVFMNSRETHTITKTGRLWYENRYSSLPGLWIGGSIEKSLFVQSLVGIMELEYNYPIYRFSGHNINISFGIGYYL